MAPAVALSQLSWLDAVVLGVLLLSAWGGVRLGFALGTLGLASTVASLAAAALGYRRVGDGLLAVAPMPAPLAHVLAFVGLALLTQLVSSVVIHRLLRAGRPLARALRHLRPLDRALGVLPGLVRGLLLAAAGLLPFALLPISPAVTRALEQSPLAARLVGGAMRAAPTLERWLGRDLEHGLPYLLPVQPEEGQRLELGPLGELAPDPEAERRMLELVNLERSRRGLPPLEPDPQLREVARAHSREMFELEYFSHRSPRAGSPFDRVRRAGIPFLLAGENLAYAPDVEAAHRGLMDSPGHRANILREQFGRVGIGVIRSARYGRMFTQNFRN